MKLDLEAEGSAQTDTRDVVENFSFVERWDRGFRKGKEGERGRRYCTLVYHTLTKQIRELIISNCQLLMIHPVPSPITKLLEAVISANLGMHCLV